MSPEDLKKIIALAELIVAGGQLRVPIEQLIKALAIAVLSLRDERGKP